MKSINDLLHEGNDILAKREEEQRHYRAREQAARRASWASLCRRAAGDLGEMAASIQDSEPPTSFLIESREHQLRFVPFQKAAICVRYQRLDAGWTLLGPRVCFTVDPGREANYEHVASLAEAVALCHRYDREDLAGAPASVPCSD